MSKAEKINVLNYDLKPSQVTEAMRVADLTVDSLMMIWGAPGIGKSQIVKQYADTYYPLRKDNVKKQEALRKAAATPGDSTTEEDVVKFEAKLLDQESNFIDFRLSQVEPSDLRGIPIPVKTYKAQDGHVIMESELKDNPGYTEEVGVVWASPEVLKLPKTWKGVILFDEINSAMPIVQAASYQLILDRCVGELHLPDTCLIVAAGNRETDGGVTFNLATPLRDRMTHVEMVPDYKEWIDAFAIPKQLNSKTIAFINETGVKHFNTLSPKDPSHAGGSSPRSWERVSHIENIRDVHGMSDDVYKALVAGRVGSTAAIEYFAYIKNVADVPAAMDILEGNVTEMGAHNKDASKNYFVALNLSQKIVELFNERQEEKLELDKWSKYCGNFLEFIDSQFSDTQKELIFHALTVVTKNGVKIRFGEVPRFKPFVTKYKDFLLKVNTL